MTDWTDRRVLVLRDLVAKIPCWRDVAGNESGCHFFELDGEPMDEFVEAWIPVRTPYGPGMLVLDNSD
ncbi:MAG: DUF6210 family protein [Planctomycetia bacterium]